MYEKLIGSEVAIRSDGETYRGILIDDNKTLMVIKQEDMIVELPKGRITSIIYPEKVVKVPDSKETPKLTVLACENIRIKCNGVRFVKSGEGSSRNDFESFMSGCPKCRNTCKRKSLGDLSVIIRANKAGFLDGMMFGDYPED